MRSEHAPTPVAEADPAARPERVSFAAIAASVPDFAIAGAFLLTWIDPFALGETAVRSSMLTMLLEFIIVHSSGFMGTVALSSERTSRRALSILGLGVFYTIFVGGFALAFATWWPLWAFWVLTLNRLTGVVLGDAPMGQERGYVAAGWALGAVFYVGGAMATTILPVPRLGVTPQVRSALDLPGDGLWIDDPQRVLAFGFLYFALTGWSELAGWAKSEKVQKGIPKT